MLVVVLSALFVVVPRCSLLPVSEPFLPRVEGPFAARCSAFATVALRRFACFPVCLGQVQVVAVVVRCRRRALVCRCFAVVVL